MPASPRPLMIGDVVSEEVAFPSDAHQGSLIEPVLFLVMVISLPDEFQLFDRLFADETKMEIVPEEKYRLPISALVNDNYNEQLLFSIK